MLQDLYQQYPRLQFARPFGLRAKFGPSNWEPALLLLKLLYWIIIRNLETPAWLSKLRRLSYHGPQPHTHVWMSLVFRVWPGHFTLPETLSALRFNCRSECAAVLPPPIAAVAGHRWQCPAWNPCRRAVVSLLKSSLVRANRDLICTSQTLSRRGSISSIHRRDDVPSRTSTMQTRCRGLEPTSVTTIGSTSSDTCGSDCFFYRVRSKINVMRNMYGKNTNLNPSIHIVFHT